MGTAPLPTNKPNVVFFCFYSYNNIRFSKLGGNNMFVLVVLIVILFAFYLFYKTKYFRSNRLVEKKWLAAKSNIALGLFVFLFGVNHLLFISETTVTYLVAAVFIIYGAVFSWIGFKKYKHYLPFAIEEAKNFELQK
jgi:amino acid transporter